MARTNQAYPPEFRQQMVELVKSGRTPNELAREYEPSAGSIRNWVAQHERDGGQRSDGLSTDELVELRRLRGGVAVRTAALPALRTQDARPVHGQARQHSPL